MALLNPLQIRVSVMLLIAAHLATRRGGRDTHQRLLDTVAPPSIVPPGESGKLQRDVTDNIKAGTMIGLFLRDGDDVGLGPGAAGAAKSGTGAFQDHVRRLVLAPEVNDAPWGEQTGARDLTNSLAWFLGFSADEAPQRMEGTEPSARNLQELDFGPRQPSEAGYRGGWLVENSERWPVFTRWACSLGFAWRTPSGAIVPDPTPAVRAVLPLVFAAEEVLSASVFVDAVGTVLPVLDRGAYRQFVEDNQKDPRGSDQLSGPLSEAIRRLEVEALCKMEDRADAPRLSLFGGSTFSHVRRIVR